MKTACLTSYRMLLVWSLICRPDSARIKALKKGKTAAIIITQSAPEGAAYGGIQALQREKTSSLRIFME